MFRCVSGTISYFISLQKKVEWLHGTRIILTGRAPNLLHILPAGAGWMIQPLKTDVCNMCLAVFAGDCSINLNSQGTSWASWIILRHSNRHNFISYLLKQKQEKKYLI